MSVQITLVRDGDDDVRELTTTTTVLDLFGDDKTIVAIRVDGEQRDLALELAGGERVEPIRIDEPGRGERVHARELLQRSAGPHGRRVIEAVAVQDPRQT